MYSQHLEDAGGGDVNEAVNQIAFADIILLNKIDLVSAEELQVGACVLEVLEAALRPVCAWCWDAAVDVCMCAFGRQPGGRGWRACCSCLFFPHQLPVARLPLACLSDVCGVVLCVLQSARDMVRSINVTADLVEVSLALNEDGSVKEGKQLAWDRLMGINSFSIERALQVGGWEVEVVWWLLDWVLGRLSGWPGMCGLRVASEAEDAVALHASSNELRAWAGAL